MNVFNSSWGILTNRNGILGKMSKLDCAFLVGIIFPAGDPAALCAAMADACAQRAEWNRRGTVASETAKSYSWESYCRRWAAFLREVVA